MNLFCTWLILSAAATIGWTIGLLSSIVLMGAIVRLKERVCKKH